MKRLHSALVLLLLVTAPAQLSGSAWSEPLDTIQQVGAEGAGNAEAAAAWRELTSQGPEIVVPVLEAMEKAGPLARNWMRTAVETVFDRGLDDGTELPAAELKAFVTNRDHDPLARHLAFGLFQKVEPESASALVSSMIDDPSPPLRRNAVAQLIDQGRELLATNKTASAALLSDA
ncbi:MAG: hypothetical protein AAF368_19260, partial [Planctomycetota bacterium]